MKLVFPLFPYFIVQFSFHKPVLSPTYREWNVDLRDCYKILRVVTKDIASAEVENIVFSAGYFCEELK